VRLGEEYREGTKGAKLREVFDTDTRRPEGVLQENKKRADIDKERAEELRTQGSGLTRLDGTRGAIIEVFDAVGDTICVTDVRVENGEPPSKVVVRRFARAR
jgi:hypothetical protein